jgi:hypothetical protein
MRPMATADTKSRDVTERSARSTRPPKDRDRPRRRRPRDEDEETPVLSGRLLVAALIIGAAMVIPMARWLGEWLEPKGPEPTAVESWATGVTSTVRITLVTADYNLLACASEQDFDGVHCQYKTTTEQWPRDPNAPADDNKLNIIQPYRTWFDNKLVFVSGLWAQPEVAFRMHQEPAQGFQPDKLARFAVECRLKFIGRFGQVKLRWSPQHSWADPDGPPWVGRAEFCKLIDEPQ